MTRRVRFALVMAGLVGLAAWPRAQSLTPAQSAQVCADVTKLQQTLTDASAICQAATTPPPTPPPPVVSALTVVNGTGSGSYAAGTSVAISATVPSGQLFAAWTGATVASSTSATTTLVMPAAPVTITATFTTPTPPPPPPAPAPTPAGGLVQLSSLAEIGTFKLPHNNLGSAYGFAYAGDQGDGTFGVTFNPANTSLFIGDHPYDERLAEIAIPTSLAGSPIATALQNLIDPLEGKLSSINPTDPNKKFLGGAIVVGSQLIVSGVSFYDGNGAQKASTFVRPVNLSTTGQVTGPFTVGTTYPGWIDRTAAPIPPEWQGALGATILMGGGSGSINALQSWGPSASLVTAAQIGSLNPVPATQVVGYPYPNHLLAGSMTAANALWSQIDLPLGLVFINGTRSVLFFGRHGQGAFCYGGGTANQAQAGTSAADGTLWCYDPEFGPKGGHAYPYVAYVWAYDANDFAAVKAGTKQFYDVKPYATWTLSTSWHDVQGAAYDPATKRIYISQVEGDGLQPLIHVYQVQ